MDACATICNQILGLWQCGSVQWTVWDEEEQKKRAARWRHVRYTAYGSVGWIGWDQATQKKRPARSMVCAMYIIRFTRMNCLWLGKRTETVQYNKMCVIRGKQVCNQKCARRPIITQTIASSKTYVICSVYTTSIGHCGTGGHPDTP